MYPEAKMIKAMKIWQLPDNKKNELSKHCNSGEYFAQEKIDGFWYQFEKTENYYYLFSRTVSAKNNLLVEKSANVPHLVDFLNERLPKNTIIIGEIYYPNKTSKDVTTIMGCDSPKAIARQEGNPLHYYIHDIIYYDGINLLNTKAELRYKILSKIWEKHNLGDSPYLRLADCVTENIENFIDEILYEKGGEGVVLKNKESIYYPDKKPAWTGIKVKKHGTADVVLIDFNDATKYYDGKLDLGNNYSGKDAFEWDYWVIEKLNEVRMVVEERKIPVGKTEVIRGLDYRTVPVTKGYYYNWKTSISIGAFDESGEVVKIGTVSSGLDDAIKEEMSINPSNFINKVVEVGYMEKDNQEKTLRHPTFIRLREDKNSTDCTIKEIFS